MHLKPVEPKRSLALDDEDALRPKKAPSGDALDAALKDQVDRLGELQRVFYPDARYALLVVLQGRDAAGKDGTVRRVFEAVNPQGCVVTSFKQPTPLELEHDFLWRIHQAVPGRRMFGVFNRSHYEDVLAVRVHELVPEAAWSKRYDQINDFERLLAASNVVILKFFLHISKEEQRRRFIERLTDPKKNWKFRVGDLADRERWKEYDEAYADVLRKCSTAWAPWYVVPSDDKKVRDYLVSKAIVRALEKLDLRYPPTDADVVQHASKII